MQGLRLMRWELAMLATWTLVILTTTTAFAELKPGDRLDSTNCQEAKGMLPEHVMEKFCAGQYAADIIEVKDEAYRYSVKFRAGTEANAGKYYVNDEGYMYETATQTWPRHWYGLPFPQIDENDPKAAYKVMYNAQMTRFQYDDTYWFLSLKWATPTGFDPHGGFRRLRHSLYRSPLWSD